MENRGAPGKPDLIRFGRMVKARRDALSLTQEEVSALGGPSDTTFTKIENLDWKPGRPATLRKLDAGLQWEEGSSARILYEGGDPTDLRSTPPEADPNNADLAIELTILIESGMKQIWEALGGRGKEHADRVIAELDAAAYLAEKLALQLSGSGEEFARRRRVARSPIRTRLDTAAEQKAEIYLPDGTLDPEQVRRVPETDPDVIAEMARRFSTGDQSPESG